MLEKHNTKSCKHIVYVFITFTYKIKVQLFPQNLSTSIEPSLELNQSNSKRIKFKISKYTAKLYKDKTGNDPPKVKESNTNVVSSSKVVGENIKQLYSSLIDQSDRQVNHGITKFDESQGRKIQTIIRLHTHQYCKTV